MVIVDIYKTGAWLLICSGVIYIFLRMLESGGVDDLRLLSRHILMFNNIFVDIGIVLFFQSRPSFFLVFINWVIKEGL